MPRFQYSRTAAISAALLAAWMLPALAQQAAVEGSSASMDEVQGRVQEPAQEQAPEPAQSEAQDQKTADKPAAKKTKKSGSRPTIRVNCECNPRYQCSMSVYGYYSMGPPEW